MYVTNSYRISVTWQLFQYGTQWYVLYISDIKKGYRIYVYVIINLNRSPDYTTELPDYTVIRQSQFWPDPVVIHESKTGPVSKLSAELIHC